MQATKNYRTGRQLSYALIIAFVLCYLLLGYFNRHSADDFDGIAAVNEKGVIKAWVDQYFSWAGPFSAAFIYYVLTDIFMNVTSLFLYNALTLLVLVSSFYSMLRRVGRHFLGIEDRRFSLLGLSFVAAMFFASPRISEIWFWFCGSIEYIWPLSFLFFGIACLLDPHKRKRSLLTGCFLFFLLGGGAINYPLSVGMIYFLVLCAVYRKDKKIAARLWLPFLCLVAGTCVHIVAPGNYVRRSYVQHIISYNPGVVAKQMTKGGIRILVYNAFFQLPYLLMILSPALLCGFIYSDHLKERFKTIRMMRLTVLLFLLYFLLIGLHCFLLYFALGNSGGPGRTRLLLHIMYCVIMAVLLFVTGVKSKERWQRFVPVVNGMILVGAALFIYKTIHELSVVVPYAKAYDERTNRIEQAVASGETNTLYLPALPASGGRTYDDPYFSDFLHRIGPMTYFLSVPNGSLEGSDIKKRRSKEADTLIDVFREDQINIRIEKRYHTPFRIDLDTTQQQSN